jgi:hypothetical protein
MIVRDDDARGDSDYAPGASLNVVYDTVESSRISHDASPPQTKSSERRSPYIVSFRFDLFMFGAPLVLALLTAIILVWDESRLTTLVGDAHESGVAAERPVVSRPTGIGLQRADDNGKQPGVDLLERSGNVLLRGGIMPLWAFIGLIVLFDVSHVWVTAYRAYTDKPEFLRRRFLYTATPVGAFFFSFLFHWHSPVLYWTLLAYVAVFHFVKQPYGFIALYKARRGAAEQSRFDYHLDRWTTWCAGLGPVLMWHASPKRVFDWFNATESFLFRLPPAMLPLIVALYVTTAVVYVCRQLYRFVRENRYFNWGKNLVMLECWVTWQLGVMSQNTAVSAACLNLFHGLPFIMLSWHYCRNKWGPPDGGGGPAGPGGDRLRKGHTKRAVVSGPVDFEETQYPAPARDFFERFMRFVSHPKHFVWFVLLAFIPALVEELLWDAHVWHQYLPGEERFDPAAMGTAKASFWVALLSVPQVSHYFLDCFMWKFDDSNPGLAHYMRPRG